MENQGLSALTRRSRGDGATGCLPRGTFGRAAAPASSPQGSAFRVGALRTGDSRGSSPGCCRTHPAIRPRPQGWRGAGSQAVPASSCLWQRARGRAGGQSRPRSPATHSAGAGRPPPGGEQSPLSASSRHPEGGADPKRAPRGRGSGSRGVLAARERREPKGEERGWGWGGAGTERQRATLACGQSERQHQESCFLPVLGTGCLLPRCLSFPGALSTQGCAQGLLEGPPCGRVAPEPGCCSRHVAKPGPGSPGVLLGKRGGTEGNGGGGLWMGTDPREPAATCRERLHGPSSAPAGGKQAPAGVQRQRAGTRGLLGIGQDTGSRQGCPHPAPRPPSQAPHPLGMRPGPSVPCRGGAPRAARP